MRLVPACKNHYSLALTIIVAVFSPLMTVTRHRTHTHKVIHTSRRTHAARRFEVCEGCPLGVTPPTRAAPTCPAAAVVKSRDGVISPSHALGLLASE